MKFMAQAITGPLLVLSTLSTLTLQSMADTSTAESYIKEAQELIANRDFDRAKAKLELADVELEDVPSAQKEPLAAAVKKALADMAASQVSANKPRYLRTLNNLIDEAEGSVGNLATWSGVENRLSELFADPAAKAAIPEEMAVAQKKFTTFKKLHGRKAGAELTIMAEANVKRLEEEWADKKTDFTNPNSSQNSRDSALRSLGSSVQRLRQQVSQLPSDADATKVIIARIDKVVAESTSLAAEGESAEVLASIKRNIDSYADDFKGWEQESSTPGPTWDAYTKEHNDSISAFFAPKTKEFRNRIASIIHDLTNREDYKPVAAVPAVKSYVDSVQAQLKHATETLTKRILPVVAAAEKATVKDPSDLSRLQDDVRLALGEDSEPAKAIMAKLQAKLDAKSSATTGAAEAQEKLIVALHAKADEIWPEFEAGFKTAKPINLEKVGQQIRFTSDNLMGYRFKPGDFYFATTLGGRPVAAKFAPGLKEGINAIETKIGRALGDNDDDGKWEVIATVTAQKVKLLAKREADSSGTVDGVDVKITTNYAESVDAVVIEIVAAKCGPFAGAKGLGILTADGTVTK